MLIFGPLGGRFRVFGHNSGPGPLRTKIFGSGGRSDILGNGRVTNTLGGKWISAVKLIFIWVQFMTFYGIYIFD